MREKVRYLKTRVGSTVQDITGMLETLGIVLCLEILPGVCWGSRTKANLGLFKKAKGQDKHLGKWTNCNGKRSHP